MPLKHDVSLVWDLQRVTNGANVHRATNLLSAYHGFIDLFNNQSIQLEEVGQLEEEIRGFINSQHQRS